MKMHEVQEGMYKVYEIANSLKGPLEKPCQTMFEATEYADKLRREWKWQGQDRHFMVVYLHSIVYRN